MWTLSASNKNLSRFPQGRGPASPSRCRVPRSPPHFSTCLQGHFPATTGVRAVVVDWWSPHAPTKLAEDNCLANFLALIGRETIESFFARYIDFSTSVSTFFSWGSSRRAPLYLLMYVSFSFSYHVVSFVGRSELALTEKARAMWAWCRTTQKLSSLPYFFWFHGCCRDR